MGGQPWHYVIDYQPDLAKAVEELKAREFTAGRYYPALNPFDEAGDLVFPNTDQSPSPGAQHASIEEAAEAADAEGFRCILDIHTVHSASEAERHPYNADWGAGELWPCTNNQLWQLFGTNQPTLEQINKNLFDQVKGDELMDSFGRGEGRSCIAYENGQPRFYVLVGYSYD